MPICGRGTTHTKVPKHPEEAVRITSVLQLGKPSVWIVVCVAVMFCGPITSMAPAQVLTPLYNFCTQNNCTDGGQPLSGLVQGTDGNFYGTTLRGGVGDCAGPNSGCGTVFKVTTAGVLTNLYSFCSQPNCSDGGQPHSGLIQA